MAYGEMSLAVHKALIHPNKDPNDPKKFLCHLCQNYFHKNPLQEHIKLEHFKVDSHICEKCGKVFSKAMVLNFFKVKILRSNEILQNKNRLGLDFY